MTPLNVDALDDMQAFEHYLAVEERRSPGTIRGYLADVRQLRAFLETWRGAQAWT